jgi:hypothetical protein
MSRRLMKVCIVGALLVSAFVGASSASASWTTNGSPSGTAFTGTGGASKLAVTPVGGAVQGITCTNSSNSGKLLGTVLPDGLGIAKEIAPVFNGTCQVAGQTAAVKCATTSTLSATAYNPATSVTTGTLSGVSCVIVKTSGACGNATTFTGGGITVTGSVSGTYGNTTQQLTVNTAGQSLGVSWSSTGCLQGTGTGTASGSFTNASGTALVYSTTSAFKPQVTN